MDYGDPYAGEPYYPPPQPQPQHRPCPQNNCPKNNCPQNNFPSPYAAPAAPPVAQMARASVPLVSGMNETPMPSCMAGVIHPSEFVEALARVQGELEPFWKADQALTKHLKHRSNRLRYEKMKRDIDKVLEVKSRCEKNARAIIVELNASSDRVVYDLEVQVIRPLKTCTLARCGYGYKLTLSEKYPVAQSLEFQGIWAATEAEKADLEELEGMRRRQEQTDLEEAIARSLADVAPPGPQIATAIAV